MSAMGARRLHLLVIPAVLGVLASGCSGSSDPDPQATATDLSKGLASGDLSGVAFVGTPAATVQKQYDDVVAGLGGVKPTVTVAGTTHSGSGGGATATATLHWTWPVGTGWSYTTHAPLRLSSDGRHWQVAWKDDVVEPSLTGSEALRATTVAAQRGDILGAHGAQLVTDRPVLRFGVDKHKVKGPAALDSARRLARLLGIEVAPYVKAVKGAGSDQFVQAIVYRQAEVPHAVMQGYTAIKGVDAIAGDLPLAITKEFAAPILGTVGPVTAEMVKDHPGVYRAGDVAGLSGLQARYDEQLRGTPGVQVEAVDAGTGTSRTAVHHPAGRRQAAAPHPRATAAAARRADPGRASGRPVRSSPSGRRPARSSLWRTAPGTTATTTRPTAASRPGRRSRPSARWRWSSTARHRRHRSTARPA